MTGNGAIVLVDAYASIYRNFHGIRGLTNDRDEPVNALYGMAQFSLRIDQALPHDFAALVMDKGAPVKRLEALPDYKANRAPMPDDLRAQIPLIREWFTALGWCVLEQEGHEADDLIAAVVAAREGHPTFIVSHDKDLTQLVCDDVLMVALGGKNSWSKLGPAEVEEKYGVPPSAILDYLALLGDSSDNIPGVPGVGAKTAAALLQQFGSAKAMLADLDAIPRESVREKIRAAADVLQRNRELVALDTELPDSWQGVETLRRRAPNWGHLFEIACDNGFKTVTTALEKARHDYINPTLF